MVDLAALVFLRRALPLLAGLALALGGCTGLIFQPMRELVLTPDQIGLEYREVAFQAADGVRLHGWFLPARAPRRGSILFLHGNAQNISTHIASVAWLPDEGFDVLLFDYRGYGRSEGSPSLSGLHLDVEAALEALLAWPGIDPARVVVLGQSLGGSLAITMLATSPRRQQVGALIVEGAFTSYRELAREKLAAFWLTWPLQVPFGLTIDDQYRPIDAIAELAPLPLLIVHGEEDRVVPSDHARALYDAARPPKELWLAPGAGHIGAFATAANRAQLAAYLTRILAQPRSEVTSSARTHSPAIKPPPDELAVSGQSLVPATSPITPPLRHRRTPGFRMPSASVWRPAAWRRRASRSRSPAHRDRSRASSRQRLLACAQLPALRRSLG